MGKYDLTYEEYVRSRLATPQTIETLESLLGETIPTDLLENAILNHSVEEFLRPYFCRELQQSLTDLSSCESEVVDGVEYVKFEGESFAMLVHGLGAYSHEAQVDYRLREGGSKTIATSLVTDEFLGHYSNKGQDLVYLGYTQVPDNSFYLSGPQDIASLHDDGTHNKRLRYGIQFLPSRQMAQKTSAMYNEYAMLRQNENGEEILPTCVISFSAEVDQNTKFFAQKHGLPVVVIDSVKYKEKQRNKLLAFEKKENPTPEELEEYLYGLVAYCCERLCYNLSHVDINYGACIQKLQEKCNSIQSKLNIDPNSEYWQVCQQFVDFQRTTTNDAMGHLFVDGVFKGTPESGKTTTK